jgi:rfaE bifunctional protein kinase chain/domain
MRLEKVDQILKKMPAARVGVIGDFCLDVYYDLTRESGEFSLETGKEVHYGRNLRSAPGGASNVVQNLAALGVGEVRAFGLLGDDVFGRDLRHQLEALGVHTEGLLVQSESWDTFTFVKPLEDGVELNRIDFGDGNQPDESAQKRVLGELAGRIGNLDVLIINQQHVSPLINRFMAGRLNRLLSQNPSCKSVVDCRDVAQLLESDVLKLNTFEVARIHGSPSFDASSAEICREKGLEIHRKLDRAIVMTRGEHGVFVIHSGKAHEIRGIHVPGETDPVGAGDTFVSCLAASMATGASLEDAAALSNIASAVVVQKLQQTGTASPQEIMEQARDTRYA